MGFDAASTAATGRLAADAPPASDKDIPTMPNAGTASLETFRTVVCFARGIVASSMPYRKIKLFDVIATLYPSEGPVATSVRLLGPFVTRFRRMAFLSFRSSPSMKTKSS
jgi:hypothetical protein